MLFDVKGGTIEELKTTQTLLKPNPNLDKIVKTRSNPHLAPILSTVCMCIWTEGKEVPKAWRKSGGKKLKIYTPNQTFLQWGNKR